MTMLEQFERTGLMPVIKLQDPKDAVPLAKALVKGGIAAAEVTFRTDAAEEAIRQIAQQVPEVLIGAGTVLTIENAQKAIDAGAQFIISPGLNPKIVDYCIEKNVPIYPGVTSPSQIEQGLEKGLEILKFFPAEASGGLKSLKAMCAAYGNVRFMPTGGINPSNVADYLQFDKIVACGGSWMVPATLVEAGDFEGITKLTKEAVQSALGFELLHLGINSENKEEANKAADLFKDLFGFKSISKSKSVFASDAVEIMYEPFHGKNGHIAIGTNKMSMAIAYFEKKGIKTKDPVDGSKGWPKAVYLDLEIAGFAIHLLQK